MPAADAPSSPPPAAPRAQRRRWRRWVWRIVTVAAVLMAVLWFARVPLVNWGLTKLPGFYDVKVDGVHPGWSGVACSGVVITHRPTGMELGRAERVEAEAAWGALMDGRLDTLRLVNAHVTWRDEFGDYREPYVEGGPPAAPAVVWQKGRAQGGSFQWIERGQTVPRLSMDIVSLEGGLFTVYNDATCEATPQALVVGNLVSRELTAAGRLSITSTAQRAQGSMTGEQKENAFTVSALLLDAPLMRMEWLEKVSPGSLPEPVSCPPRAEWDKPVLFRIADAFISPGRLEMQVHQPSLTEPVELTAAIPSLKAGGVRLAGGLPGVIDRIAATLADIKAPRASAEGRTLSITGTFDDQAVFHVSTAEVQDLQVTDSGRVLGALGFSPEEIAALPLCTGVADVQGGKFTLSEKGLTSAEPQRVKLRGFTALLPGEKEPAAALPEAEIAVVPDEAMRDRRLRIVTAEKPALVITKTAATTPDGTPKVVAAAQTEEKPGWFGWHVDALTVRGGHVRASGLGAGVPDVSGAFAVQTAPPAGGGDVLYNVHVSDIRLANPFFPALPIPTGGKMELQVHPRRFWEAGEVERAEFNGQRVELNSGFMQLFKPAPGAATEPAAATPPEPPKTTSWLPPLRVKKLVINDVQLSLDDVGDGRKLTIPLDGQEFTGVPLTSDLLEHDAANTVQKIEVPAIYVYAPYDEGQTVVELPVNFIHFTFAGLAQKRLERVELVAPKIKAGRPLFDFIDRARKRFSSDDALAAAVPLPPELQPLLADNGATPPLRQLLEVLRGREDQPAVWDIPFYTDTGMVITAPNGEEWTDIPRLPFRNARIKDGPQAGQAIPLRLHGSEVTGELAIAEGWYDFPAWKLRLHMSGEGSILFNFPLADQSTNLVQVFKGNALVYRDLRIDKVWLSITYDKEGIYASYGGETCGGYITGKVNLYLDQTYTWDASASFTGIEMKPFTSALTREHITMTGRVEQCDVIAHGDMNGLYQTTVDFKIPGRGRLRVHSLDALQERLRRERVDWSDDAARAGVNMLRDFLFHSCEGSARLYGREGTVQIKLAGSEGRRDISLHLHDYRLRREKSLIRF